MRKGMTIAGGVLAILLSVSIMAYPVVSTIYNTAHQSEICIQHQEAVESVPDERIQKAWEDAAAYNQRLHPISQEDYTREMLEGSAEHYKEQLNLLGDGIMGYVEIPRIKVYLPVYHGTNDATLERGIGHLLGSSLPVGGVGTHTVLTAHSGMASQKMFSDLPQLERGDRFYLHVLDQILAYEVGDMFTVLPHDTTYLGIDSGHDRCTLVTCTPFGVNTHRLLVRGERVSYESAPSDETIREAQPDTEMGSNWEQEYVKGIFYGILIVVVLLILAYLMSLWEKHREKA